MGGRDEDIWGEPKLRSTYKSIVEAIFKNRRLRIEITLKRILQNTDECKRKGFELT